MRLSTRAPAQQQRENGDPGTRRATQERADVGQAPAGLLAAEVPTQRPGAALMHLNGLHRHRNLQTNWTQHPSTARINDAGLSQNAKLINLEQLSLAYTQISDAGLAQLERLKRLEGLSLEGTQVTDVGL